MNSLYNVYIYDEDGTELMEFMHLDAVNMLVQVTNNAEIGAQCLVEKAGVEMEEKECQK